MAALVGADTRDPEVLHRSNNVVIRFADVVLKVSTDFTMAERDVVVASHVSARDGPALAPLLAPIVDGDFSISAWPYLPNGLEITERDAGEALRHLHRTLVGVPTDLPPLSSRFDKFAAVLADSRSTAALDPRSRAVLRTAIGTVAPATKGAAILHTEPHDRNRLRRDGRVVYIDFEAAAIGPTEWDLAYLQDNVVQGIWPDHDPVLRATLRIGVSACVSIACWRHVTARPRDADMRWHAEHHLEAVRRALT
ncbi:MAG: aminoglycoside phosphotransferase family protein [Actinomycetota bacterium]|nr:aminoglycoside phosphotransferase family protein [Actinomycetota bacterium]